MENREIGWYPDSDFQRIVMKSLMAYLRELEEKGTEVRSFNLEQEKEWVGQAYEQLKQAWLSQDQPRNTYELRDALRQLKETGTGSVIGFDQNGEMIQVTYHPGQGFKMWIESQYYLTQNLHSIYKKFSNGSD